LRERGADAVLTVPDSGRCDEDGVVGVVGDDLVQVTRAVDSAKGSEQDRRRGS